MKLDTTFADILKRARAYKENAKHPLSKDAKAQLESKQDK